MKKNAVCHSFENTDECELIEKIVESYFYESIHATRKWRVRKNAFSLVLFQLFEFIAHNYNSIKKTSLDMKNEKTRYHEYGTAGMLFEVSKDNNREALKYGKNKVGIRALKAVFSYFEQGNWMSHENGFCCRNNESGKNPYKLGIEYIDFEMFLALYNEYFKELNELFGIVTDEVAEDAETVRACVSKAMKAVCGFIFGKTTVSNFISIAIPIISTTTIKTYDIPRWTGLRLAA